MTEIEIRVEPIDGETAIVFPDGDCFPITAPIHEFLFHLFVLSPVGWDGNSFKVIIPEPQSPVL
jgi:hypothetical protein